MAFCFKRREPVAKAIGRLGCQRIESALECLKDCARAETIHGARKDIKRTRALLRLARAGIARKDSRRFTRLLREAASGLAPPRDAYIRAKTLADLAGHFKGQLAPGALRHVRSRLRRAADEQMKCFREEKRVHAVEQTLNRLHEEFECLEVDGKGWAVLGPGVKRAYGKGQRAFKTVLEDSSPENFHKWRKRAKDLWYQVTLLHPVWPEQMDAMAGELETMGEYLGDDHDLFVLRQSLQGKGASDVDEREWEILHGLIDERQRDLRAAAIALGERFYAEKPSTFCDRLARYWHAWRRDKKRRVRAAETTA
jgi:CHAD domain-containing protein